MPLPLTQELRDYPIPNIRVDVSSHSNLRVVTSSFFPASELLSISLIPNLRVVVYPFHIRPQSCMFPFSNPSVAVPFSSHSVVVLFSNRNVVAPFSTTVLSSLFPTAVLSSLFQPQCCRPFSYRIVVAPLSNRSVVVPFSNRSVVAPFPTTVLSSLFSNRSVANHGVVVPFPTSVLSPFSTSELSSLIVLPQPQSCMLPFLIPTSELSFLFSLRVVIKIVVYRLFSQSQSWVSACFQPRSWHLPFFAPGLRVEQLHFFNFKNGVSLSSLRA